MKNTLFPLLLIFALMIFSFYRSDELTGPLTEATILEAYSDWQEVKAAYIPQTEPLDKLKSLDAVINVEVMLGTWCPDCKQYVSAYFKIIEMAANLGVMIAESDDVAAASIGDQCQSVTSRKSLKGVDYTFKGSEFGRPAVTQTVQLFTPGGEALVKT